MRILADYSIEELENILVEYNQQAYRAKQIFQAIYDGNEIEEISTIPKSLREKFNAVSSGVKIKDKLISKDKTVKYLFQLFDGNIIEGVVMNYKYGNTICISTQVGCRMNCSFCASGLDGLIRNLSAGEMAGQIIQANKDLGGNRNSRKITNIVLMGSGEPLDNYDNVIKFLHLISAPEGLNFSLRNISLSTCGIADKILLLSETELPINLTISLHSPRDDVRSEIMPINKAYSIKDVLNAARVYFKKTGRRVIIEYALISEINDSDMEAKELAKLVRGFPCHINIIRLNHVKERKLSGSQRVKEFIKVLEDEGASCTLRRTMGNDIEGACGQLRRRYLEGNN